MFIRNICKIKARAIFIGINIFRIEESVFPPDKIRFLLITSVGGRYVDNNVSKRYHGIALHPTERKMIKYKVWRG